MNKYTERVRRGAALLDAHVPGWESRVQVAKLHNNWTDCILGQIFGSFDRGLSYMYEVAGYFNIQNYGFNTASESDGWDSLIQVMDWKAAWVDELFNRRAKEANNEYRR